MITQEDRDFFLRKERIRLVSEGKYNYHVAQSFPHSNKLFHYGCPLDGTGEHIHLIVDDYISDEKPTIARLCCHPINKEAFIVLVSAVFIDNALIKEQKRDKGR